MLVKGAPDGFFLLSRFCWSPPHCSDVIMSTIASQITSLTIFCSTVYSGVDQRKHQSSVSLAFVRGIHRYRWIPRTKGQQRGKCFHLMASSCTMLNALTPWSPMPFPHIQPAMLAYWCLSFILPGCQAKKPASGSLHNYRIRPSSVQKSLLFGMTACGQQKVWGKSLIHCGLVMPYDDIDMIQHWLTAPSH